MALLGPRGFDELGELILQRSHYAAALLDELPASSVRWPRGFFKEFVVHVRRHRQDGRRDQPAAPRARASSAAATSRASLPALGQSALYCVTEVHSAGDIDRLVDALGGGDAHDRLRRYHAAVWDEPLVMELGRAGRRGFVLSDAERVRDASAMRSIPEAHAPRGAARRCPSCPSSRCSATTCTSRRRRSG